ncbi:MAG: viroplasmin family protein, partial [Bacteroidota bacterium]
MPTFVPVSGKSKFYTVWEGRRPGVYTNWVDCIPQGQRYEHPGIFGSEPIGHHYRHRYPCHRT